MNEFSFQNKNLLVVDDEDDLRDIISTELNYYEGSVFEARNIREAETILKSNSIDLVISDVRMPGGSGFELLKNIKSMKSTLPVILMTGFTKLELDILYDEGVDFLLSKPFNMAELLFQVDRLLKGIDQRISHQFSRNEATLPHLDLRQGFTIENYFFARGGISLELTYDKTINFSKDTLLQLSLDLPEIELRGQGLCRWIKFKSGTEKIQLGIEFSYLEPSSWQFFAAWLSQNSPREFIKAI